MYINHSSARNDKHGTFVVERSNMAKKHGTFFQTSHYANAVRNVSTQCKRLLYMYYIHSCVCRA